MKEYLRDRINELLERFEDWLEQDTELRSETFDVKWMSAHNYLGGCKKYEH